MVLDERVIGRDGLRGRVNGVEALAFVARGRGSSGVGHVYRGAGRVVGVQGCAVGGRVVLVEAAGELA